MLTDLRLAARGLLARPGFTAIAVLALALGTGANTMLFSVVNAVLLRPVVFAEPDRLFVLTSRTPAADGGQKEEGVSPLDLADIAAGAPSLAAVGGIGFGTYDLTNVARPTQTRVALPLPGTFEALGMRALHGRLIDSAELATGAPVVMLDEQFWRGTFDADPAIVGRTITLDRRPFTVVGVAPRVSWREQAYELWGAAAPADVRAARDNRGLTAFGRLAPGATAAQAREELAVIARRLAATHPKENTGLRLELTAWREWDAGALHGPLLVLLGAVAFVLLVACTNVANMLLARAAQRTRELAIRTALGATRQRLVRQLLAESAVLAVVGSLAGVALASVLLPVFVQLAPLNDAQRAAARLDDRVMLAALAIAGATVLLFGLWPALSASRADANGAMRAGGDRNATGRGQRVRGALVMAEVALASVLLTGAALLGQSLQALLRVERGWDPALTVNTGLVLPDPVYPTNDAKRAFVREALARLEATPGVASAAVTNFVPISSAPSSRMEIVGRAASGTASREAAWRVASPTLFHTLRIPLVKGRLFTDADDDRAARVALVSRALAEQWFPGEDPVGRELHFSPFGPPVTVRIVGVVGDVRAEGRGKAPGPEVYLPYAQQTWGYFNFVVRGERTTTDALLATIERTVRAIDPVRPTFAAMPLEPAAESDASTPRFGAALMGMFAVLAALLACIGVFGVTSFAVTARTREIGIRSALGGAPRQVLAAVLRPSLLLVAGGAAIGAVLALACSRVLASQLHGVRATEPLTYAAAILAMAVVGVVASWIPARRALRVAPTVALQSE